MRAAFQISVGDGPLLASARPLKGLRASGLGGGVPRRQPPAIARALACNRIGRQAAIPGNSGVPQAVEAIGQFIVPRRIGALMPAITLAIAIAAASATAA